MTDNKQALVEVVRAVQSEGMQAQMKQLLPKNISLDRFTAATIAAISNFPEVLEADKDSLYRACVNAAKRGLLPDKEEGALVLFNTKVNVGGREVWVKQVQFMPMVKGIIMEMAKAGIRAYAVSVHASDKISMWNDDEGQHVHHEPQTFGERGDLVGVFAAAKDLTGRTYVEAMAKKDIEQVRARSKQKDDQGNPKGTWKSDYDRMAQKSALHRLRKRLPIVSDDGEVYDMEDESAPPSTAEVATPAAATPAHSPPQLDAPKQAAQDEVLKPARGRRPKVMDQVMAQAKKPIEAKAEPAKAPEPKPEPVAVEDEGDIL